MANVRAYIALKARVAVINTTPLSSAGLPTGGPTEGAQWHNIHHCVTKTIDLNEWKWRFATAKAVLCGGTAPYGTTYGGAIGLYALAYGGSVVDDSYM
jgi:hypothetical protein